MPYNKIVLLKEGLEIMSKSEEKVFNKSDRRTVRLMRSNEEQISATSKSLKADLEVENLNTIAMSFRLSQTWVLLKEDLKVS